MTGEFKNAHYDYWVQSFFEWTSDGDNYNVQENICNTEHILPDDWRFGLQQAYNSGHGSNWTTHSGQDHFMYGEDYESEYKDSVSKKSTSFWTIKSNFGLFLDQFLSNFELFLTHL